MELENLSSLEDLCVHLLWFNTREAPGKESATVVKIAILPVHQKMWEEYIVVLDEVDLLIIELNIIKIIL